MSSESIEVGMKGVSSISYLPWREELIQGITLRNLDGDPKKPFDLAFDTCAQTGAYNEDWRLFRESVASTDSIVVRMEQVHGGHVEMVSRETIQRGLGEKREVYYKGCDGLITDIPNLILTARVADCVPIFLYNRRKGAIGLLHAGWRGTAAEILPAAVERMKMEYGSEAPDIEVYLGPSIEKACYPVSSDVFAKFDRWNEKDRNPEGDWKVDLRDINRQQAIAEGIPAEKIAITHYCTACSAELLYSHRASGGDCGRMAAFSVLR